MPGWRAEIERVWTKRSQKRIDISYDLLNVSLQQQQRFISDIRACKEKMRRTKKRDQVDGILHELLDRHNPSIIACLVHGSRAKLDFPGTFLRLVGNVGDAYPAARVICFRDITDLKESLPMFAVYRSTEWRHPGSNFKEHAT